MDTKRILLVLTVVRREFCGKSWFWTGYGPNMLPLWIRFSWRQKICLWRVDLRCVGRHSPRWTCHCLLNFNHSVIRCRRSYNLSSFGLSAAFTGMKSPGFWWNFDAHARGALEQSYPSNYYYIMLNLSSAGRSKRLAEHGEALLGVAELGPRQ